MTHGTSITLDIQTRQVLLLNAATYALRFETVFAPEAIFCARSIRDTGEAIELGVPATPRPGPILVAAPELTLQEGKFLPTARTALIQAHFHDVPPKNFRLSQPEILFARNQALRAVDILFR